MDLTGIELKKVDKKEVGRLAKEWLHACVAYAWVPPPLCPLQRSGLADRDERLRLLGKPQDD